MTLNGMDKGMAAPGKRNMQNRKGNKGCRVYLHYKKFPGNQKMPDLLGHFP